MGTATTDSRITAASVVQGARFKRGDAEYEVDYVFPALGEKDAVVYARRLDRLRTPPPLVHAVRPGDRAARRAVRDGQHALVS